jgi:hypothetical protein
VLPESFDPACEANAQCARYLDVAVIAVRLNDGAPCSRQGDLFAPWPGPQAHVRRWFLLENGKAVGMDERPGGPSTFPVVDWDGG